MKYCMNRTYKNVFQNSTDGDGDGAYFDVIVSSNNATEGDPRRFYLSEYGERCPDGHDIGDPSLCEVAKNDFIGRIGDCSDIRFIDDQITCEYFGSCGAASGVGNGSKYDNNATGCKSANVCGAAVSKSSCVWTANNTWTNSGFCSTGH